MGVAITKEQFAAEPCNEFDSGSNTPYSLALKDKFPEVIQQLNKYLVEINHFHKIVGKTNKMYKNMAVEYEKMSLTRVQNRIDVDYGVFDKLVSGIGDLAQEYRETEADFVTLNQDVIALEKDLGTYIKKSKKEEAHFQDRLAKAVKKLEIVKAKAFKHKILQQETIVQLENTNLTAEQRKQLQDTVSDCEKKLVKVDKENGEAVKEFYIEKDTYDMFLGNILTHLEYIDRKRFKAMRSMAKRYSGIQKKIAQIMLHEAHALDIKIDQLREDKEFSAFISECRYGEILDNSQKNDNVRKALESFASLRVVSKTVMTAIQEGLPFDDQEFPPTSKSIFGNAKNAQECSWLRAPEILGPKFDLFHDGIEPDDIQQGSLGDCYFLSALSCIAREPILIERLFSTKITNQVGIYELNLCVGGEFKKVIIDDYFPVRNNSRQPLFAYNKSSELWVIALEKAYSKMCGYYFNIEGGNPIEAFELLTGYPSHNIFVKNQKNKDELWKELLDAVKKNNFICCSSIDDDNGCTKAGLVANHAYAFLECKDVRNNRLVYIRNPWGKGEWTGAWSDADPNWTPEMKKEAGYSDADDGRFFMSFNDFLSWFDTISLCRYEPAYSRSDISVPMTHFPRGDSSKYPVICVDIDENQHDAYFGLHQLGKRFRKDIGNAKPTFFSFIVIQKGNVVARCSESKVIKCNNSTYTKELVLRAGKCYLVPFVQTDGLNPEKIVMTGHLVGNSSMKLTVSSVAIGGENKNYKQLRELIK